jgi:hypothetical protein
LKKCGKCKKDKVVSNFSKDKTKKDGRSITCKQCVSEYDLHRSRSECGVISQIYRSQKTSSKRRGHNLPSYNKDWFTQWVYKKGFKELYDNWVLSGYNTMFKPSVDRFNDYEGYNKDNIQLKTWGYNNKRSHEDRKSGINNKMSKAVVQTDTHGNVINEYHSQRDASRKTGIAFTHISSCCLGKSKTSGGFCWRFKDC